jgi:hypothetical protein
MDDKLNEDVNMLLLIKGIGSAYPAAVAQVPQMVIHFTTLGGKIVDIKALAQSTGISIHGLYVVKGSSKEKLVALTATGCAAIRSLANATDDEGMRIAAKWKAYQLDRLHKNDLVTKSEIFLAQATTLGAQLIPHGFEAADLTEWDDTLTDYIAQAEDPGVKKEIHKADLAALKELVAGTLRWMTNVMDDTAMAYQRKNPEFYRLYKFGREKHHQGHRKNDAGEDVVNPGEYILDILRGGGMAMAGFPILPGVTYFIENLKNARLRFWTQASPDVPATIPSDSGILEIEEDLEKLGSVLGAPDKPYLFFANESATEDGQVSINSVEG